MSEMKNNTPVDATVKEIKKKNFFIKAVTGMKSALLSLLDKLYGVLNQKNKLVAFLGVWSLFLNYLLEASLRKSFIKGFIPVFNQPFVFLFNALIIFATFSLMLFVKRRMFYFLIGNIAWLTLAVVNIILLQSRTTPFNGSDFRVMMSAFEIIGAYLSVFEIILVILLISAAISLIVLAYIRGKKSTRYLKFSGVAYSIIITVTMLSVLFFMGYTENFHFANLPAAYREYGFAYSFIASTVDRGIERPDGYDENLVKMVANQIDEIDNDKQLSNANSATIQKPNVIFVQLESFYDPTNIVGLTFNKDPISIFRSLEDSCMSGKFTVPSIGAGTANTEFEVLTGMDIDHFGIAEYPYLSILQKQTCESMAYNFKEYGYAAHVLHNHTGTFYDRHMVFPNLGFDTFVSVENMGVVSRNYTGWAKDSVLFEEIIELMSSTENQADFIYGISVQPHGKYPYTEMDFSQYYNDANPAPISVMGMSDDPQRIGIIYWINQVYEVDLFIGEFINSLKSFNEPTILVMYGDHLPSFDVNEWLLKEGDCFQTEYVIWSNFDLENRGDRDLYTFQIGSYIMDMVGIDTGYMNMLHRDLMNAGIEYSEISEYNTEMHILQYDVLYGNKYLYDGISRYLPTNIKYGYKDIVIDSIALNGNTLYVYGEGFSDRYSYIYINGSKKETTFIKEGCLSAENVMLNNGDVIKVVQGKSDRFPMSETNHYVYLK